MGSAIAGREIQRGVTQDRPGPHYSNSCEPVDGFIDWISRRAELEPAVIIIIDDSQGRVGDGAQQGRSA